MSPLGVPFLDRARPAALAAAEEGRIRAELAAFLTRASTDGGVVLAVSHVALVVPYGGVI